MEGGNPIRNNVVFHISSWATLKPNSIKHEHFLLQSNRPAGVILLRVILKRQDYGNAVAQVRSLNYLPINISETKSVK